MFKDSINEVQYRRPTLHRNQTILRQRTVSDQSHGQELQLPPAYNYTTRRSTNDMLMSNLKNQIKNVDTKLDSLSNKIGSYFKGKELESKAKQTEKLWSNEEVDKKIESLAIKIVELTNCISSLKNEFNKK